MPQKGVSNKVEVIHIVSIIPDFPTFFLEFKLIFDLNYVCFHDFPLEVYSITQVHFAKVYEIMFSLE